MTETARWAKASDGKRKSLNDRLRNVELDEGPLVGGAQAA